MKKYLLVVAIVAGVAVIGLGVAAVNAPTSSLRSSPTQHTLVFNGHEAWTRPSLHISIENAPPLVSSVFRGVTMKYDPFKPTDGAYPRLLPGERIWIDVSIDQQLVYLFHGPKLLYTMATSSGMENVPTDGSPLGVYHIQAERGTWFYVPRYREGAEYWVSWLGHGIYLFHSVPMNRARKVIPEIAARLLHEASHGCFHLTIPDAKWFYENVPYRTTVIVERSALLLSGTRIYDPSADQLKAVKATESSPPTDTALETTSPARS